MHIKQRNKTTGFLHFQISQVKSECQEKPDSGKDKLHQDHVFA